MNAGLDPHQEENSKLTKEQGGTVLRASHLWKDTFIIHAYATTTYSARPTCGERWTHTPRSPTRLINCLHALVRLTVLTRQFHSFSFFFFLSCSITLHLNLYWDMGGYAWVPKVPVSWSGNAVEKQNGHYKYSHQTPALRNKLPVQRKLRIDAAYPANVFHTLSFVLHYAFHTTHPKKIFTVNCVNVVRIAERGK